MVFLGSVYKDLFKIHKFYIYLTFHTLIYICMYFDILYSEKSIQFIPLKYGNQLIIQNMLKRSKI